MNLKTDMKLRSLIVVLTGLMISICAVACSPKIDRVYLLDKRLPPKPETAEIKLFTKEQPPTCQFEVIGIVTSLKQNTLVSMDKVAESLRKEARKMGGDAVIGVEMGLVETGSLETNTKTGAVTSTTANNPMLKGTVIRWLEADCIR